MLTNVSAAEYSGSFESGIYTGNTAAGNIVEREANGADTGYSSIMFSWNGPVKNGTNENGISTSEFGISSSGDIYVVTFGPELEDEVSTTPLEEEIPEETPSSSIPSSGGGGGGSSHRDTYGLVAGDILTIIIDDETHTITVDSVGEDSATLTVASTPQTIELVAGETKELDITDTYSGTDVAITLDSVSDLRRIVITVEDLTAENNADETTPEETPSPNENSPLLQTITGAVSAMSSPQVLETAYEVKQGISTVTKWIILVNIALGILVGMGIAAKKIEKQRIYAVFHQKTKQEFIAQELKRVEDYVKQAMKQGYRYENIKLDLLDAGWQEYEVDEVVVNAMLAEKQILL